MAVNGGQIRFGIGFNVDQQGLRTLQSDLEKIQNMSAATFSKMNKNLSFAQAVDELDKVKGSVGQLQSALNKAFNADLGTLNISKFNNELKNLNINELYSRFQTLGPLGQQAFQNLTSGVLTTNIQLKQSVKWMDEIANTMTNTVKWGVASSVFNSITMGIQSAYSYVQGLDSSLNDIRIVTGKSADEMSRFAVEANEAARNLSASTRDITEAALIYYQQGDENAEAMYKAQVTTSAANVSGIDAQEMSDYLTAVWNGYQVANQAAEEGIGVYTEYVDKLAAVAASTASDLAEVATGMSKVASVANQVGVDFDSLNAQISTIVSVTRQAPETVGNALRTIYARIADLKIDGELGKVSGGLADLGIQVLDTSGELRNMDDILAEIAGKWDEWDTKTQTSTAQLLAGKYQYNSLVTLFNNWDGMYSDALETSLNATGELAKQQDIYSQRITAHIQEMRTSWESVADSFLDEDFQEAIKTFVDGFATLGDVTATIFDSIGGGLPLLQLLSSLLLQIGSRQIGTGISSLINNFKIGKENAAQLNAELEITKTLARSEGYNDAVVKGIVDRTQAMQQYYSVMSEGDIKENKELISKIASYEQQKQAIEQNTKAAEEFISKVTGISNVNILGGGVDDNLLLKFGNVSGTISEINELSKEIKSLTYNIESTENGIKIFNDITTAAQGLVDTNVLNEQQLNEINGLLQQLKGYGKIDSLGALPAGEQDIEQINTIVKELIPLVQRYGKEAQDSFNEAGKAIDNNAESYAKVRNSAEGLTQQLNANKARISQTFDTTQVVKFVGELGQVAFALQQIANLGDIWSNEDITAGEKILQTLISMSFVIPSLAKAFSAFGEISSKVMAGAAANVETAKAALRQAQDAKEIANLNVKNSQEKLITLEKEKQAQLDRLAALASAEYELSLERQHLEVTKITAEKEKQAALDKKRKAEENLKALQSGEAGKTPGTGSYNRAEKRYNKQISEAEIELAKKENELAEINTTLTAKNNSLDLVAQDITTTGNEIKEVENAIEAEGVVLKNAETAATEAATVASEANVAVKQQEAAANNVLTASLSKLKAAFVALPLVGQIAIVAAAALTAVVGVYKLVTESSEEAAKKAQKEAEEYDKLKSKVDELEGNLQSTLDRIKELNEQDSLTFVEQQELDRLKESESLLRTEVDLYKSLADEQAKVATEAGANAFEKQFGANDWSKRGAIGRGLSDLYSNIRNSGFINNLFGVRQITEEDLSEGKRFDYTAQLEDYTEALKRQANMQKLVNAEGAAWQSELEESTEDVNTYKGNLVLLAQSYSEQYQKQVEAGQGTSEYAKKLKEARDEILKTIDPATYKTEQFNEMWDELVKESEISTQHLLEGVQGNFSAEYLQKYYGQIFDQFNAKGFTAQEVVDQLKTKIQQLEDEMTVDEDQTTIFTVMGQANASAEDWAAEFGISSIDKLIGQYGELNLSAKEYAKILQSLSKSTDTAKKAMEEYNKEGYISIETAIDLIDSYEGFGQALEFTKDGIKLNAETLAQQLDVKYDDIIATQQQNIETANNTIATEEDSIAIEKNAKAIALSAEQRKKSNQESLLASQRETLSILLGRQTINDELAKEIAQGKYIGEGKLTEWFRTNRLAVQTDLGIDSLKDYQETLQSTVSAILKQKDIIEEQGDKISEAQDEYNRAVKKMDEDLEEYHKSEEYQNLSNIITDSEANIELYKNLKAELANIDWDSLGTGTDGDSKKQATEYIRNLAESLSATLTDTETFKKEYEKRINNLEEQFKEAIALGNMDLAEELRQTIFNERSSFQAEFAKQTQQSREYGYQLLRYIIDNFIPEWKGRDLTTISAVEINKYKSDLEKQINDIGNEINDTTDETLKESLESSKQALEKKQAQFGYMEQILSVMRDTIGFSSGEGSQGEYWKGENQKTLDEIKSSADGFKQQVEDQVKDLERTFSDSAAALQKIDLYEGLGENLQREYEEALKQNAGRESETSKYILDLIKENQDAIAEVYKERQKAIIQQYEDMNDELKDYIDLLDEDSDTYLEDKADLLARQAATLQGKMAINANEIERIRKALEEDPNNQGLLDYLKELQKEARQYVKDQQDIEDSFEELNEKAKEAVDDLEDSLKEGIGQQLDDIEDGLQDQVDAVDDAIDALEKEKEAAEDNADAIKAANDAKKDALQSYLDMLEKIWDAEDEENERQKKLQQRSELVQERNRYLTAGATGDLEALSSAQDKQKEIQDLDEELKEDAIEAWREAVREAIQSQIDELEKANEALEKQLEVLEDQLDALNDQKNAAQEQLDAFKDLREELEDDPAQMAALLANLLQTGSGEFGGIGFSLDNMTELIDRASGEFYKATYDGGEATRKLLEQGLKYYNAETGYSPISKIDYATPIVDALKDERKKMREWLAQLGYTVEGYDKGTYKTTISKDGQSYVLDPEKVLGGMEPDFYHYATGAQMQEVLANAGIDTSIEDILRSSLGDTTVSMDSVTESAFKTAEALDTLTGAIIGQSGGTTTTPKPASGGTAEGTIGALIGGIPNLISGLLSLNNADLTNFAKSKIVTDQNVDLRTDKTPVNNNVDIKIGDTKIEVNGNADALTVKKIENMIDTKLNNFTRQLSNKMGINIFTNRNKY